MPPLNPDVEVPKIAAKPPTNRENQLRANTGNNVSLKFSWKTAQAAYNSLSSDFASVPMAMLRQRYTLLDLAYSMETSPSLELRKNAQILHNLYEKLSLPLLQPNIDAAHAYLCSIFTTGHPIFGVVSEMPNRAPEAVQMEAIIEENSTNTGWARHLIIALLNGLKYNIAAVDIDWRVRKSFNLTTDTSRSFTEATVTDDSRAGNEIVHTDMYNTFFDTNCGIGDIHAKGDFAGYIERLTLTKLYALITDLQSYNGTVLNIDDKLWKSAPKRNWYHTPNLISEWMPNTEQDWNSFFNVPGTPSAQSPHATYEVIHYYRRIIPSMWHIEGVPDPHKLQVWKFIEVNGILIYAERKTNAHNYLPMVFMQPKEDSLRLQTKGIGQQLLPHQNLSDKLFSARLASLSRAISDRALFDPSRISKEDINSPIPTAKIAVRPSVYGKVVSDAYHQIPYDDRHGESIYRDIQQVGIWAGDTAHINRAQRGQFQKGNKTLGEFNEIMDNADGTQQTMATLIENQFMVPLKYIIKINVLQYQEVSEMIDVNTNQKVQIDPTVLRNGIINFKIASGLMPKDKLMSTESTLQAFQVILQSPSVDQFNQEYDILGMLVEAMENRGARLRQHKRTEANPPPLTPEQQAAQQEAQQVQSAV